MKDLLHLGLVNLEFALGGHQLEEFLTLKEKQSPSMNLNVNLTAPIVIMHVLLTLRNLQSNGFQIPLLFLAGYPNLFTGNILITRVYFVEGVGHNLFSVGQFCDSDLEVAFRRNTCFVRNLYEVDLLKGTCTTNLYTINLHEMASTSLICLMARATSTKSWLWPNPTLSLLNVDTINYLAKKESRHRSSQNSNFIKNILVLISKVKAPEVIKTFLKRITVLLQSPVIIIRTDNSTKVKNQILKEYFDNVSISHQASSIRIP
ncbi:hypothetical protein Tco_0561168 [Tanacetum coccineum]